MARSRNAARSLILMLRDQVNSGTEGEAAQMPRGTAASTMIKEKCRSAEPMSEMPFRISSRPMPGGRQVNPDGQA